MKRQEVFPSPWLKGADINEPTNVTIRRCSLEIVGEEKTEKPVLWFHDLERGLILNVTNWKAIETLYGEESDSWQDEELVLFTKPVEAFGETHSAIRVRGKEAN